MKYPDQLLKVVQQLDLALAELRNLATNTQEESSTGTSAGSALPNPSNQRLNVAEMADKLSASNVLISPLRCELFLTAKQSAS